ncbi:MAG: glucokinase [Beijerinckiaceae bacterium]
MSLPAHLPHPCLVADVGGTNARFALAETPDAPLTPVVRLPTGARNDFAGTVEEALGIGGFQRPRSLLAAVAGPLHGLRAELTNAETAGGRLRIDGPDLAARLGLEQGMLFNDFEALSLATPFLADADTFAIGGGSRQAGGPILVVGPGTGLGVGALLNADGRLLPVASEGGHVGIGPETDAERAVWPHLAVGRLSAEDLISGRGLFKIYRAVARMRGENAALDTVSDVTKRIAEGGDTSAREAGLLFLGLLGSFAGDMALVFCATGGVFIGGGVTPRLQRILGESTFRTAFESKGPLSGYAAGIATRLILADEAALIGLSAVAAAPQRFLLDYEGRFWRS